MSVISLGMDLIECSRIATLLERHGVRFLNRVLTPAEREHAARLRNRVPHVAGRFAAKEAILKVLGTGWRGQIAWTDMAITNDALGRPQVSLSGACARRAAELGIETVLLTITHTEHYAAATALGIGGAVRNLPRREQSGVREGRQRQLHAQRVRYDGD